MLYANNTSGFKGVSYDRTKNLWEAYVYIHNEDGSQTKKRAGRYGRLTDAVKAQQRLALKLGGF